MVEGAVEVEAVAAVLQTVRFCVCLE